MILDTIRQFVENLLVVSGFQGAQVPVLSHAFLVVVAALLAILSYVFCRLVLVSAITRLTRGRSVSYVNVLFERPVLIAFCGIVPAIVIWQLLPLVFYQHPIVRTVLTRLTAIYITLATVHLCFTLINQLKLFDNGRRTSRQQYIISFLGVLRIVVVFLAVIVIVSIIIDRSPFALFAGLGATSAVLMLVFKDTIEGLGAGIRLTSNDMMHVGDWITVDSAGADGIVTEMSLTTVKVQNFDKTVVTISPMALVSDPFKNWKGMQDAAGRLVNRKVFFDFRSIRVADDNPNETNMLRFRNAAEEFLKADERVNNEMSLVVRQLEATQCGLPLAFYFFLKSKEGPTYDHHLAEIMEKVYVMAADFGLTIYQQYPEQ